MKIKSEEQKAKGEELLLKPMILSFPIFSSFFEAKSGELRAKSLRFIKAKSKEQREKSEELHLCSFLSLLTTILLNCNIFNYRM